MEFRTLINTPHALGLAILLFTSTLVQSASAQSAPSLASPGQTPERVYTYVEQMPRLLNDGSNAAIIEAIKAIITSQKTAPLQTGKGIVYVALTVGSDGLVRDTKIVKGMGNGYDETVLAATQQLPRFVPGRQNGKQVAVSYTLPIAFPIQRAAANKVK